MKVSADDVDYLLIGLEEAFASKRYGDMSRALATAKKFGIPQSLTRRATARGNARAERRHWRDLERAAGRQVANRSYS
jgi:hypothetical protein